jgi:exopolyphosphatase / guanosine-5'-triphosphate,3'-diphosphate pyrophosphatase
MTIATIDIGTNTILLLIARMEGGKIIPLCTAERVPRLGRGVDRELRLHPEGMERATRVLEEYLPIIRQHSPAATVICGTSALRDAANSGEFSGLVARRTGCAVEVLSGEEEAIWSFRGALSGFADEGRVTVLDIGGGSTEITSGTARRIDAHLSADIGAVRLTERFFQHDPPTSAEMANAEGAIERGLAPAGGFPFTGSRLAGVAGTVISLAHLSIGGARPVAEIPPSLSLEEVERLTLWLSTLSTREIMTLSPLMEGRGDVIIAGAMILRHVMRRFGFGEVRVNERGLRYGLVLREWERHLRTLDQR